MLALICRHLVFIDVTMRHTSTTTETRGYFEKSINMFVQNSDFAENQLLKHNEEAKNFLQGTMFKKEKVMARSLGRKRYNGFIWLERCISFRNATMLNANHYINQDRIYTCAADNA